MKILLFGGTFDPPHNGHMNNLRAAMDCVQPDKVIVMPAGIPPHKKASGTEAALRLAMCECFTALSPKVEVSDWEVRQGGRNYSVNTVEMLRDRYPNDRLYMSGQRYAAELYALVSLAGYPAYDRPCGRKPRNRGQCCAVGRCRRTAQPGRHRSAGQGAGVSLCVQ